MDEPEWLAEHFEEHRTRLRAVAYRMLGSLGEADDAVQEAWLRLSRTDTSEVENLDGWLTTVVARASLNMLRSRNLRREEPIGVRVPEPIVDRADGTDPEHEALLADSVGLALLVVLETLSPPERLAFVLHDMFAVPFDEIVPIVDRSPEAARQLASRARRRVQGENTAPDADLDTQREVVDAFLAAARDGDFDALVAVLDRDVVLRADIGPLPAGGSREVRGAAAVASQALAYSQLGLLVQPALINGAAGVVSILDGQPFSVVGFTVRSGKIVEIDILADSERLRLLDLTILDNSPWLTNPPDQGRRLRRHDPGAGRATRIILAVIPLLMLRVVDAWRAAGSPPQEGMAWPRQRWTDQFPTHASTFANLPDYLTRSVVRRACLSAANGPADAERAFLAVMVWGYGQVGYGPFRVRRLLDTTPHAGAHLQAAATELASGGPVKAYAGLGDHGAARLARLGPAFGTKFLYFCSPARGRPALILDRLVARWLRDNTDLALNEARWSVSTYAGYLDAIFGWADELHVAADELEALHLLLASQARREPMGSRRSDPPGQRSRPSDRPVASAFRSCLSGLTTPSGGNANAVVAASSSHVAPFSRLLNPL